VFNFIPSDLSSNITFTRASSGTFVGSNGLIQTAAIDVARFSCDPLSLSLLGLLIEAAASNAATYSEQFQNAAWGKTNSTISQDATVAPDGTTTGDKIIENTANGNHGVTRIITATATTTYTQSIYVKAAGRTKGQLLLAGNSGGSTVSFDLTAKTATASSAFGGWSNASASIQELNNGWFRVTNTATTNTGLTGFNYRVYLANASGSVSYTGDGSSGLFVWGAQIEAASSASSYMPAVASPGTRSADSAAFTIPSGVTKLRYVFDSDSTQDVTVAAGAYTIPTNLNRPIIKAILGLAY
jgi:hypothetical protein